MKQTLLFCVALVTALYWVGAEFDDDECGLMTKDRKSTVIGIDLGTTYSSTAAAIAFGFDKKEGEKNILVFDLGGGTFDVSLLTINNGVFEVVSTNGNTHLGGEDFDQRVMKHFIKMYMKKTGKDITKDNHAVQKLRREVEKAKRTLSSQHQTRVEIESLFDGKDFSETLTRAKFEELNLDLFHSTLKSLQIVLDDADMKKEEVAEVVLVGGSTRIPKVQQLVKDFFNGKEPYRGINPDEAVVYGAAVQAGVLSRKENMGEFALLDVNPFTLHIEIEGRGNEKVIPHNTVIPTKKILHFTTNINEPTLNLLVYEREHSVTNESQLLGRFVLIGMSSSQRVPHIEVIFKIDINGILRVTDYKGTSDIKYMVVPHYKTRLSKEDIERMVKDAKKFAYDDKKVRKHVDAKIGLESFIYKLKHQISGKGKLGAKLSASRKRMIEVAVEENISWLESHADADAEEYKERKKELEEDIQPIISKLYKNAGGTSTPGRKGGDHDEL